MNPIKWFNQMLGAKYVVVHLFDYFDEKEGMWQQEHVNDYVPNRTLIYKLGDAGYVIDKSKAIKMRGKFHLFFDRRNTYPFKMNNSKETKDDKLVQQVNEAIKAGILKGVEPLMPPTRNIAEENNPYLVQRVFNKEYLDTTFRGGKQTMLPWIICIGAIFAMAMVMVFQPQIAHIFAGNATTVTQTSPVVTVHP